MKISLSPPLSLRKGPVLRVLDTCRVSDPRPGKQDVRSNDDQAAAHREWLQAHTDLPFSITVVEGSDSGERLDRESYLRLIALVETGNYDLVLAEDLGRIVRRIHAHLFCELCVDMDTRLIAIGDNVDTFQDGWEDRSIFSAWHHERANRDTSGRIKRTHRNRFINGEALPLLIVGYRKRPGAKSDDDVEKIPEWEPIYREWFRLLDEGANYTEG